MKSGLSLQNLAVEIDRVRRTKCDYLIPSSALSMRTLPDRSGNRPTMAFDAPAGLQQLGLTEVARRQLADKLRIPFTYFKRMQVEQPTLLDANVNTWLDSEGSETRMIRTLDGNVRAVLSKRYRPIDNWQVAEWVLPLLNAFDDARVESCALTETRMFLKVVTPRITEEVAPGDLVQAGVVISNSEVGHGSLHIQPLVFRLRCRNGLVASEGTMRRAHIGRMLATNDDGVTVFQDDTLRADDRAFMLKVRDVVKQAMSESTLRLVVDRMRRTTGIVIEGSPVRTVKVLADRYALNEEERGGVLRHLITGGDLSGYGLVNAVTAYSQEVTDYQRATDFEELGGKLLDLSAQGWRELAQSRKPLLALTASSDSESEVEELAAA
jgi:hypothetical protein